MPQPRFDVLTAWGAGVPATDQVDATGPSGDLADRASAGLHLDSAVGLSVLRVGIEAGPTNRQDQRWLPVMRGAGSPSACCSPIVSAALTR